MAWHLWAAALVLADTYSDHETWEMLKSDLPPLALPSADPVWMARFVGSFDAIADRVAEGASDPIRLTTCTGEEMALHIVIDNAEDWSNDGVLSTPESLLEDAERDVDFESARDVLFRGHEVLLLFDAYLTGLMTRRANLTSVSGSPTFTPADGSFRSPTRPRSARTSEAGDMGTIAVPSDRVSAPLGFPVPPGRTRGKAARVQLLRGTLPCHSSQC